MEIPSLKKILLLIAIMISLYILYRLIARRQDLLSMNPDDLVENFGVLETFTMASIRPIEQYGYPLKEHFIYSSWNSCVNSNGNVSLSQLENVMMEGVRFLDFEIYDIQDSNEKINAQVGYSEDSYSGNNQSIDSLDTILFSDICKKIVSSQVSAPNGNDPLFIHLRIRTKNIEAIKDIYQCIENNIKTKQYNGLVDSDTILSELKNRIIVIIDKHYIQSITDTRITDILDDFTNMYSSTSDLPSKKIYNTLTETEKRELSLTTSKNELNFTNVESLMMVTHDFVPDTDPEYQNIKEDDFKSLIMDHSVQIIPYKFHVHDENLTAYKNFFSNNGKRAMVPMALARAGAS